MARKTQQNDRNCLCFNLLDDSLEKESKYFHKHTLNYPNQILELLKLLSIEYNGVNNIF